MSEPRQKPGRSKQDYGTPRAFIEAVERRWGPLHVDLAASPGNAKAPSFVTERENSLIAVWGVCAHLRCWLNPPFGNIGEWAERCAAEAPRFTERGAAEAPRFTERGGRIFLLTPASIGSEWFQAHVHRRALVLGVRPRLTFEGTTDPYPKDLMLSVFGEAPGFDTWRWKP